MALGTTGITTTAGPTRFGGPARLWLRRPAICVGQAIGKRQIRRGFGGEEHLQSCGHLLEERAIWAGNEPKSAGLVEDDDELCFYGQMGDNGHV